MYLNINKNVCIWVIASVLFIALQTAIADTHVPAMQITDLADNVTQSPSNTLKHNDSDSDHNHGCAHCVSFVFLNTHEFYPGQIAHNTYLHFNLFTHPIPVDLKPPRFS